MKTLPKQTQLIEETDWQALIILDACRADYFRKCCPEPFKKAVHTVYSPARDTLTWMVRTLPILNRRRVTYYTANPQCTIQIRKHTPSIDIVNVWEDLWAFQTPLQIPSVNPWAVNGWVLADRAERHMSGGGFPPYVVHYIQPHFPAIGNPPLAIGQWMTRTNPFSMACHKSLCRPEEMVKSGKTTIREIRAAYRGNVELVVDAALALAQALPGPVVITADHGEVLGEAEVRRDGTKVRRYGHSYRFRLPELLNHVPWLVINPPATGEVDEEELQKSRLRDLGYL